MKKPAFTELDRLVKQLADEGADDTASAVSHLFDLARRIEDGHWTLAEAAAGVSESQAGAGDPASSSGKPQATGRPGRNRGHASLPPGPLNRGSRPSRAQLLALAEMHVAGVSTEDNDDVIARSGLDAATEDDIRRAAILLDEELDAWCRRPLGEVRYLILGEHREAVRRDGDVCQTSVLFAVGVGPDERRRIIGTMSDLPSADRPWARFLEELTHRGMRGVRFVLSDDLPELRRAREAVFPSVPWQYCQFHLTQAALDHVSTEEMRKRLAVALRHIWDSASRHDATDALQELVAAYRDPAPALAGWLNDHVPAGLTVFQLPGSHRRFMRSTNAVERAVRPDLKRSARKVRIFPSVVALERLVRANLVEIDEKWASAEHSYLRWCDRAGDRVFA